MEINADIKRENFNIMCRTCLQTETDLVPIHDPKENEFGIAEMLEYCTVLKISTNDLLPKQICINCVSEISQAFEFAQKCNIVDEALRNCLTSVEAIKIETKETQDDDKCEVRINKSKLSASKVTEYNNTVEQVEKIKNETLEEDEEDYEFVNYKYSGDPVSDLATKASSSGIKVKEIKDESMDEDQDYSDQTWNNKYSDNLNSRTKTGKRKPTFCCKTCDTKFKTKVEFQKHRRATNHPVVLTCSICHKQTSASNYDAHVRTHTKEKPFACSHCDRAFSLEKNLRRHEMMHTGERPHKCEFCPRAFIQRTSLVQHLETHQNNDPVGCKICGKMFKYNSSLQSHLRFVHDNQGGTKEPTKYLEFECPQCLRTYHSKPLLKQHMLIHGEKKFLCSKCGKSFFTQSTLYEHAKTHNGIKPHSCQLCGKSFTQSGSLRIHILSHTGERPHTCNICNKKFTQSTHLKGHMRIHNGEKPYKCVICNKAFSLNGTLTVHMRTHTGETPYICSLCRKGFYNSTALKKHKKKHGHYNHDEEENEIN